MKFAIIDLGTNTFNLIIAEKLPNNTFKILFNTKLSVKLGEGSINKGFIDKIPFQRGISALISYKQHLIDYNVNDVYAFATSAIRSAKNGVNFINEAKIKTGISITIIDGEEEATLIYHGNKMAVNLSDATSLIMDIGGGSTEFILANKNTIFWKQSFLLGAARLLEMFKLSDPLTNSELIEFNNYLKTELNSLFKATAKFKPNELIGSSGAFDSVVDIIDGEFNTGSITSFQTEYSINLDNYNFVSEKIKKTTLAQRSNIKGLIEMRIDMIVISFLLIDFILKELNLSKMRVSTYSLKEGVIFHKLGLSSS